MATKVPRIAFVPSPEVRALLEEISEASGRPVASIASEILDDVVPVLQEALAAMKAVAAQPERARELVNEFAVRAVQQVGQATLDFEAEQAKKRKRKKSGKTWPRQKKSFT